jgi:hypothetical protein
MKANQLVKEVTLILFSKIDTVVFRSTSKTVLSPVVNHME